MSSSNKATLAKLCKQHYHVLPITNHIYRYLLFRCLSLVFTTLSARKTKQSIAFGLLLLAGIFTTSVSAQTVVSICDRTVVVENAILATIPGTPDCIAVTAAQLAAITELDLSNMSITALQTGDFADLTGLTTLRLQGNTFTTPLPANLFDDLPSAVVIEIDLAPVDFAVALDTSGMITIDPADAFISRDSSGNDRDLSYSAVRSNDTAVATVTESGGMLTITAINNGVTTVSVTASDGVSTNAMGTITVTVEMGMSICDRTTQVEMAILAAIPASPACDAVTAAQLAAITALNLAVMSITTLQAGDFAGLSGVTFLSLNNNSLSTLPTGIFDNLTSLTTLDLSDNDLTALPDGLFLGLVYLATLRLQGNTFTTPLPSDLFGDLLYSTVIEIDLAPVDFAVALDTSGMITIDPADAFISRDSSGNDRDLSYSAVRSNDTAVATVTESGGMLTITAINNGVTTVSVTASDGVSTNAMGTITVTVEMGMSICDRTTQVEMAILAAIPASPACDAVTAAQLAAITELYLAVMSITTLQAGDFAGLSGLTFLDLGGNNLSTLPTGIFDNLTNLAQLDLSSNNLTTIEANAFSGLTNLTELFLSFNALTTIEANTFSGLNNLTILFLNGNALTTIEANAFSGLTSLAFLFLSFNALTTIEANAFSSLMSLTDLDLGNNALTTIEANVFSGLTSLIRLDLDNNALTTIEANTFSSLMSLTELYLNGNDLTTIEANAFSDLTDLTTLRLQGNTFTTPLPANLFDDLPSAAVIEIDLSPIGDLADIALTIGGTTTINIADAFISKDATGTDRDLSFSTTLSGTSATATVNEGVVTITASSTITGDTDVSITANDGTNDVIRTISVTAMGICSRTAQVQTRILRAIPAISDCMDVTATHLAAITGTLNLQVNGITALQAGDFADLTSLTRLELNHNNLSTLPAGVFDNLTSLTQLDLFMNDLTMLPAGVFDNLTSLTSLNLGFNDLSALPAGIFDNLTSLTFLDLGTNDLSALPAGIFDNLTSLTFLDLGTNDLSALNAGVFDNLRSLTRLDLGADEDSSTISVSEQNNLSTLPAGVFDNLTSLTRLDLAWNDLGTLPAGIFDNLRSLTFLNLRSNDLTTLPAGIFDNLTNLTELRLNSNYDLSALNAGVFDNLTNLTILRLGHNNLSALPDDLFNNLTSLTRLQLESNDLSALPAGVFNNLTSLMNLRLEGNTFTTPLPANLFDPVSGASISIDLSPIGDLPDVVLTVGGTTTINIANAFISRGLNFFTSRTFDRTITYTATPANTAVATATEDSGVVTITGAGAGATTVSVLADDDRSDTVTRGIAVTVAEAGILAFDEATGDTLATPVAAENNGTDMVYVQLASAPTSDVTMTVMSSATAEGTVTPSELTFTTMNWNARQAVTITAVPDQIDRDDTFTVDFVITSGDGGAYLTTLGIPSVAVTVTDDDTAGIDGYDMATGGSEITAITTSEGGDMVTTYVELTSEPTGTVTVTIGGIDTTEHTLTTPASNTLTFDSTNWNTPRQAITITGVDDDIVDGDQTYTLTLTATGGGYDGVVETGLVTNTDNDTAEISIADLSVDENASTATLTVTLTPAVTAGTVEVDLTTTDGTATIAGGDYTALTSQTLTFTAGTISQTLDIPINDDTIDEVDETFTVTLDNLVLPTGVTTVTITDATAEVTITDDDTLSDTINLSVSPLTVAETADATTITVTATIGGTAVSTMPTTVTVSVGGGTATSGTDYAAVTDFALNIPALSLSGTQTFMIDPTEDTTDDNNETVMISGTATGFTTVTAAALTIVEASISVFDAMTLGNPISTTTIAEASGTGTLYVQLASEPAASSSVTISVASSATNEGIVNPPTLTFSDTNWNVRQALTVTAVDDNVDRDDSFMVNFAVTGGDGGNYTTSLDLPSVAVTITDDDTVSNTIGLSVSPLSVAETADATTITVTATIEGTAVSTTETVVTVSVGDVSDSATEGTDYATVADFTLNIPALSLSATQTFMIDPTEDTTDDNNETVTISGTAPGFTTINPATLTIVEAGISVHDAMMDGNQISTTTIAEASGMGTLYVQLTSEPAASSSVTISVASSATGEGTVTPATLTFTDTNWDDRQALTVTAVDDNIDRENDSFMVNFAVISGDGVNYTSSLTLPSTSVLVTDNDVASDTIALNVSPNSVTETAGETTITVTATLNGAASATDTAVEVIVSGGTASPNIDYTLAIISSGDITIPTGTITLPTSALTTITIPELMTSGSGTFTITPVADNENDNEETITISGTATGFSTINSATLTITGFSREEQQVIEQTVAAQASSVTQVVSENIGSFLASRTSAPPAAPAPPTPDGGGGGDINRENFTSIDWQDWQHRFAKLAYEGLKRLDSDADMSLDWALKAAGGDGRLLMPLGIESLTLWAAGGRLKTKGDGMGKYDGGVNSFVVGVDTNLINNWLLGIAASYSDSQVDYTMDGAPIGSNEQNLFSVHPFLSHSLPDHGLTLWVTGGYGVGDIDFSHTTNGEAASDVTQWMAAGGIEKHIITNTLWQGALRLKGLWGNATVDATEYDNGVEIRKVESTFWRARMESEMGYNFQLPGANVRPYALIGGRWDHNDAIVSGDEWHIDIGGGVEVLSHNAFALNISVHTQVTDGDTEEDSIVGTGSFTYDIGHDRQGLQISLSRPLNNTSPSWDQHSFNEVTDKVSGVNSAPLTSELAYGWTVRPFGLKGALQTYVQNSFDSDDRHYAVGLELAINALTLNFETGYHDHTSLNSGETDNTGLESLFKTKIRW